jgi:hypothetical protein
MHATPPLQATGKHYTRGSHYYAKLKAYDRRRGGELTVEGAMSLKQSRNALVFEPLRRTEITTIKEALRKSLTNGTYTDTYQAQFNAFVPSPKHRAMLEGANASHSMTRVVSMLGALSPSADLVLQFRSDGQISSHSDLECVFLVPRYFQNRQSSVPTVLGIMLVAIPIKQRQPATFALHEQSQVILEAVFPLEAEW